MVSFTNYFRRWFTPDATVYECRNCGTTLDVEAESCPNCEPEAINCYDLN